MAEGNGNGTARWQLWATIAGVGIVLIGSMMTLYVQVNTAYTTSSALEQRVERLSAQVADNRSQITQLCSALVEVETQFRASDGERNLTHASDLRVQAMLWQKAFGSEYPIGDAYYPSIAQEQPGPCH